MNCTTVCTAGYINIIAVHITNYATHIANNSFFTTSTATAYPFLHKTTGIACTGSHNVAAVINTVSNSIILRTIIATVTKITGYAANIMRAADFVFLISCIGNIGINSFTDNATNIACIIIIIAVLLAAADVSCI